MPTTEILLAIAQNSGVIGLLIVMVMALVRGWVVTKSQYDEMKITHAKQLEEQATICAARIQRLEDEVTVWQDRAWKSTELVDRATGLAAQMSPVTRKRP